ncbi:MAG: S9 family peptidase, partial [Ignavibacteriales bacterium]|nr:S9 family peptidase [Ignavibacteriales bacterium]
MNKLILTCVLIAIAGSIVVAQTSSMNPPIAKKIQKTDTLHGDTRVDNYFWLREKTNPEVISYLNAENAYTESQTKTVQPFGDALYKEFLSRIKQTDLSVPYKLGDYWYYTKTIEGKQYTIYCRKKGGLDAPEEVTLDLNQLAEGHKFLGLGAYEVSDDGNFLAYSTDTTGFRQYYLFIKDMRTGKVLPDKFGRVISVEWAADNKNIFYTTDDAAKRPYQLYRHELGAANDQLLYEEKDELYRVFVYRTSDKKYLVLQSASSITTEARYLPANTPTGEWNIMLPREINHEYVVDHHEASFFIRTNKNAKNYKLVAVPDTDPRVENWQEILPHRPDVKLEGVNLFASYAVFNERENGLTKLRIMSFATGKITPMDFPEPVYMASPSINPEFVSKVFRFNYQSLVTPSSVFDYDMETGKRTLMKQTEVLGGYDPTQYVSERVFAKAKDGTMVPISLVYK